MHGPSKMWFESGEKLAEENFVDDKRHGQVRLWNKDGKMLVDVTFDHGRYDRERHTRAVFVMMLNGSNNPDYYVYNGSGTLAQIIETFGPADEDKDVLGKDNRLFRLWTYRCKDGNLTMQATGGPFFTWDGKGGKITRPSDKVTVSIYGNDNFPSVNAHGTARNLSEEEFRKKVGGMMINGSVDSRIHAATCDASSFFQTFGLPDESVPREDTVWFCHRYTLRNGSIWLYLQPSGKNAVMVRE